ncbi:FGGY-family carbohydrate kinase [Parasulfitobacter algicola]|uniref:FGGY-family carbohydrate kinase n=1 Tax=Parasulfitobacter algicola TaxID=2614809 RepID=A0ABX2INJ0_9RHOB|nr:FGGY-family carbohydrate kinase [Sulfitobacter algicola]NSX53531.1 FGGY-family carbohydrate kinase [Sulfitobacter algicola]
MTELSLGIDIGTSGIRTAVLNKVGDLISSQRVAHEPQDPNQIDAMAWWRSVVQCVRAQCAVLREIGHSPDDIMRIGVDGTSGTMVLTDAKLRPVTRALMYNSSGFEAEAAIIARHAPDTHITRGSNSALGRALRLQSEDTGKSATHLLHQADFIIAHLLGRGGVSDYNNALKTGFDPATRTWPDWFAATGLCTSLLPNPVPAGALVGQISSVTAQALGVATSTQIHAGTTDSIAAFLAAAPLKLGAAVTSLGTTLAIKILSDTRIDDPNVGLYSHRLGDFWLVGGASNTGGGVLADLFTASDLDRLSNAIDPDMESPLDLYPLLKPGERFPINDPEYPPRMNPRPASDADYLHGLLESIARIEAQCYDTIVNRGGAAPKLLFTAGGGAENDTWTHIRARVLGLSPNKANHSEASVGIARLIQDMAGNRGDEQ